MSVKRTLDRAIKVLDDAGWVDKSKLNALIEKAKSYINKAKWYEDIKIEKIENLVYSELESITGSRDAPNYFSKYFYNLRTTKYNEFNQMRAAEVSRLRSAGWEVTGNSYDDMTVKKGDKSFSINFLTYKGYQKLKGLK